MKIRILYIGILWGLLLNLTACNDWLEVISDTEVESSDLLNSEDGFKDAIIGVYINMGDEAAYGKNYTWYANDLVAFPYKAQTTLSAYRIWQSHQYTSSMAYDAFEAMWARSYNVIANINNILSNLESNKSTLNELTYNLMKGEMLALRAYLHFDLLRLFGLPNWNQNAEKLTVPYVTEFSKEQTPQRSYSETAKLLFADIAEALSCLQNDPITGKQDESYYETINRDGFWNDRTKRMNYYAVKALAARAYMWEGSETNQEVAAQHAQDVIDANPTTWIDLETFAATTSADAKDWTFSTEHLFSLEVMGLADLCNNHLFQTQFEYEGIKLPSEVVLEVLFIPYEERILQAEEWGYDEDWNWIMIQPEIKETVVLPSANDVRYHSLLTQVDGGVSYNCMKLYQSSSYYKIYRNRIPMIKISEMYYIVAENYIRKGQSANALEMLDVVRKHRGITEKYDVTADASAELTLEYMREFICEGQLLYYWKRTGATCPVSSFELTPEDLIFPYPRTEISNGGRQQDL